MRVLVVVAQDFAAQPFAWRSRHPDSSGLIFLRIESDGLRRKAPHGTFVCGVRAASSGFSFFSFSVSTKGALLNPRNFDELEVDSARQLELIPFAKACHKEHLALKTSPGGEPLTLKVLRVQGPLPPTVCVFFCQSADRPLVECQVGKARGRC